MAEQVIGRPVPRSEDARLLTGRGRYVADVNLPGMLHAAIVRSQHAHGRLLRVDLTAARALPGVVDAFSAVDIPQYLGPIPVRLGAREGLEPFLQRPLAIDRVRYVGEPIAVIVATDRYLAEDAAAAVSVEIEPLPALASIDAALDPHAPALFDVETGNLAKHFVVEKGDVVAAFAEADLVVETDFAIQRHSGVPLETRGIVAAYDAARGDLDGWGATKVPHFNRMVLAQLMALAASRIHFHDTDVGGGFGVRGEFYPEDLLIPVASLRTGRPVKWIEDRWEHMVAANHSREQRWRARLALRRDGRIVALDATLQVDMGAYMRTHGTTVPTLSSSVLIGPYVLPHYRCAVDCVLTNKTPTGTYRGPGQFESNFVRERLIDLAAVRLGIDRAEVRRRNFIRPEQMPYDTGIERFGTPVIYDSGDYAETFELALQRVGYDRFEEERALAADVGKLLGIGFASFVESTGTGPPESARVSLDATGNVSIVTGAPSLGQGQQTTFAQVCAEVLQIPLEWVRVSPVDTDLLPAGGGTFASRGAVLAASAVYEASRVLRERLIERAAKRLGVPAEQLRLAEGAVIDDTTHQRLTFAQLARSDSPYAAEDPELSVERSFQPPRTPFTYGTQAMVVEVDPETGQVAVRRGLIAEDPGRVINPHIVEGQLVGAMAQGLGGTLLEEFAYSEDGQPLSTTFMDYLLPTAAETPAFAVAELEHYPSPLTPLGAKGVGESGIAATGAAIANAVADAIGETAGEQIRVLPLTPERILAALGKIKAP